MASTNEFFYFSGWVPKRLVGKVKKSIEYCEDRLIITEKEAHEVSSDIVVPTSMRNNFIVRPFESMVHMYAGTILWRIRPNDFPRIKLYATVRSNVWRCWTRFNIYSSRHPFT